MLITNYLLISNQVFIQIITQYRFNLLAKYLKQKRVRHQPTETAVTQKSCKKLQLQISYNLITFLCLL